MCSGNCCGEGEAVGANVTIDIFLHPDLGIKNMILTSYFVHCLGNLKCIPLDIKKPAK